MADQRVDVAVVGGGMTGVSVALGLARAGHSVALLEPGSPAPPGVDDPHQLRVSTLSPASRNILHALGAWETIQASGRAPMFDQMRVWERDRRDELHFSASDASAQAQLGWVAENELIRDALWQQLEPAGVQLIAHSVERIETGDRKAVVATTQQSLSAKLVVGADGGNSIVRQAAGIEFDEKDYAQRGLVCNVRTERSPAATAWQRFLIGGPLALLPVSESDCSVVWSLPTTQAQTLASGHDEQFNRQISQAFGDRLGAITCVSERASFPLRRRIAERYVAKRLALIGDAAHVIHPLAGQGANIGFLDAAALVELVGDASDAGDERLLARYQRWRRSDNAVTAAGLEIIKAWYGQQRGVLADIRRFGTGMINRSGFARARFVEHASGFGGRVPQLARN